MKPIQLILTITGLAASTLYAAPKTEEVSHPNKPNIVFILADDLGYGELGCYGQKKIKTPNIDQLRSEGIKFTQHYSGAAVCAPSRCVLLTGKHLAHAEIRGNKNSGNGRKFPGQWPISAEAITMAETLKSAGYVTGAFGKWGLGPTDSTGAPNKQGFDRYYGYICQLNAHSYYPAYLDSDDKEVTINEHPIPGRKKQLKGEVKAETYRSKNYAPDLILAEALKFIDKNKDKPFFLYLPFVEPHLAMQPSQESIDQYPKSWDDPKKPYRGTRGYLPHPRPHAGYAAMISDLDRHVGKILDRLKKYGLDKNTIIIFTSDNGATNNVGGVETEFFDSMAGLRGKKGSCYEGGLRMPCIVRWPGKIKPGSTTDVPTYFPDWFPTFVEISGAKPPATSLDGESMVSLLKGGTFPKRHEPMIWEFNGSGGIIAIREGKWKALRRGIKMNKGKAPKPWELYDIEADPKETNDVAKQHPEIVQRLEKMWLKTRTENKQFTVPLVDKK